MSNIISFFTIWITIFSGVSFLLYKNEKELNEETIDKTPIAQVSHQKGEVDHHSINSIVWQKADEKQFLFLDDYISTNNSSYTDINIFNIGTVKVFPNSQLRFSTIANDPSKLALILINGKITAHLKEKENKPKKTLTNITTSYLAIFTETKFYEMLEKDSKLTVKMEPGFLPAKIAELEVKGKILSQKIKRKTQYIKLKATDSYIAFGTEKISSYKTLSKAKFMTPLVEKKQSTKKEISKVKKRKEKNKTSKNSLAQNQKVIKKDENSLTKNIPPITPPRIEWPKNNDTIWFFKPFSELKNHQITFILSSFSNTPENISWKIFLKTYNWQKQSTINKSAIDLNFGDYISTNNVTKLTSKFPEYSISLFPGIIVKDKTKDTEQKHVGYKHQYTLRSIYNLGNNPIKISLRRFSYSKATRYFYSAKKKLYTNSYIILNSPSDIIKLTGLLPDSLGFKIEKSAQAIPEKGVHIIKDGNTIGYISKNPGVDVLKKVASLLKAKYQFNGISHIPSKHEKEKRNIIENTMEEVLSISIPVEE